MSLDDNNKFYTNEYPDGLTPEEIERKERVAPAIGFIRNKYEKSKTNRRTSESNWLDSYRATRGEYSPEERARMDVADKRNPGSSKVFVKVTKTKVQAAYGQVLELLDDVDGFPIDVEPTPVPEGIADVAHITPQPSPNAADSNPPTQGQGAAGFNPAPGDLYGYEGDGREIAPGETTTSLLRGLATKFQKLMGQQTVEEGPANDPRTQVTITPAQDSANKLRKVIQGQLSETHAMTALRKTVYDMIMLGTGVLKGPFTYRETIHRFEQDPDTKEITYKPFQKLTPKVSFVSLWNIFPDDESPSPENIEWLIERHLKSKSGLKDLANEPYFDKDAISRLCANPPKYAREYWENEIVDNNVSPGGERYEVLEYWGYLDAEVAKALGLEIPETLDIVQVNIWVCDDEVIRAVLNPFVPARIPYYFVPYELHPGLSQIWGIGVPENMKDTQSLMNGHMRMAIDNLRYAGSVVFEVNEAQLVPGQDMTIYPGKVFRKQGGAPGQSVYGITFPNTATSHLQMYDKARQLADEQTFPSYAHGQTGVTGTTRTASGMGMLFSAAAQNIKTVVSNLEFYLLRPLGENLFYWNMQFNDRNIEIRGDYKIVATGTSSLLKKEILSQRLLQFLQVGASNPSTAPMLNYEYLLKEVAKSMGLDSEKAVNSLDRAKIYAQMIAMGQMAQQGGGQMGANPQGVGGQGGVPSPTDASGTGGGNIGAGTAQPPQPQTGQPMA